MWGLSVRTCRRFLGGGVARGSTTKTRYERQTNRVIGKCPSLVRYAWERYDDFHFINTNYIKYYRQTFKHNPAAIFIERCSYFDYNENRLELQRFRPTRCSIFIVNRQRQRRPRRHRLRRRRCVVGIFTFTSNRKRECLSSSFAFLFTGFSIYAHFLDPQLLSLSFDICCGFSVFSVFVMANGRERRHVWWLN